MKWILFLAVLTTFLIVAFGNNFISLLTGVPVNCMDGMDTKKTGISNYSKSIGESQLNNVFSFEFLTTKNRISLEGDLTVELEELWVEQHWSYECLDSGIYVVPTNDQQLLMKVNNYDSLVNILNLVRLDKQTPCACSGVLRFHYSNQETPLVLRTFDSSGYAIDSVKIR